MNNKRRAKENLHPLLGLGGNLVAKDEEKAEVLNALFDSVFNSVLGLARTGLIFTRLQEGAQPGGGG